MRTAARRGTVRGMKITRLPDPAAFDTFVPEPEDALLFYVFFGSEVPETGESWCPDCVMADPVIRATLSRITARPVHLVECPVGDRASYKGRADHPYRVHPHIRLQRIPTVVRVERGREVGRLVEGECLDPQNLLRLAAAE